MTCYVSSGTLNPTHSLSHPSPFPSLLPCSSHPIPSLSSRPEHTASIRSQDVTPRVYCVRRSLMAQSFQLITQRRSVAKSVACFQRRLFVCLFVNTITSERVNIHRMMKLGARCTVQKSRPSSNFGVIAPWVRTCKNVALGYDVGKISAGCLVVSVNIAEFCQQTKPERRCC